MNNKEQRAVLTISLMAAFADGVNDEREREQIKKVADGFTSTELPDLYQNVILKRRTLNDVAAELTSNESRQLAYEMAVCICNADGVQNEAENTFLDQLRTTLALDPKAAQVFTDQAVMVAAMPMNTGVSFTPPTQVTGVRGPVDTEALDKSILNYSILNGALELLPQSLASMAILPLQMKMVYSIGKAYGYELDRGHIKDFAATLGVGITGQYLEQMGRKLIGGVLKMVGGGLIGGLGSVAVGSSFSFATTFALGQVAKQYYSAGRTIDLQNLKQVFVSLLEQGKTLQNRYSTEIQQKARTIDVKQIADIVRQG